MICNCLLSAVLTLIPLAQDAAVPTGVPVSGMDQIPPSPVEAHPASFRSLSSISGCRGSTVLIVVAEYLSGPLAPQIAQLQSDVASEGWTVEVQEMAGGTVTDLRSLLRNTADLDGAILIGHLPCAWFEDDYWGKEEFPCELFLMDLDGFWHDADADGLFDDHTGDVEPEIWIGRLDAHTAYGPECLAMIGYLEMNHAYRTGSLGLSPRALVFNDDDWSYYDDCGLCDVYGPSGVTVVNSYEQTTAENYLSGLSDGYEFVHLMSHSCPWGHTFKVPGGMAGTVMAPEISELNPGTAFLQLFSCSNARWVEEGCLGNWYLFGTDSGLLISGSAKTGSMLDFEEFYGPLASGMTFGEAFREWWSYQAQGGFSEYQRAWFYGNALLGDPTLRPLSGSMSDISGGFSTGGETDFFQVSTSLHSDCFPSVASSLTSPRETVTAWLSAENGRLDIAARTYHEDTGWDPVVYVDPDEYWDVGVSSCYHDTSPWIVWSDFDYSTFSYRIKTACGQDFSQVNVQVDHDGYQVDPDLASDGTVLWLSWLDWDSDGGTVWIKGLDGTYSETQLSTSGSWCQSLDMAVDGDDRVHLVWEERSPEGCVIMTCRGDTSGFTVPEQLSSGQLCHSPSLDFDPDEGTLACCWISETGTSSIIEAEWLGDQWGPVSVIHTSAGRISHVSRSSLPQPWEYGWMWQEGCGADASVMALPHDSSQPFQLITSSGPCWAPATTANEIVWASNSGTGWEIYSASFSSLGVLGPVVPVSSRTPRIAGNPVRGSLRLTVPNQSEVFDSVVRIFDLTGRVVISRRIEIHPGSFFELDCNFLPSGIYVISYGSDLPTGSFLLLP